MNRRHAFCAALVIALAALPLACSDTSRPTAPDNAGGQFAVVSAPGGPAGTVTVGNSTCACLSGPLEVRIDGERAGMVPCDGESQFDVAATSFTVTLSAGGVTNVFHQEAQGSVPESGVYLSVTCR